MSQIENVMSELESIGVIGDGKVVLFKPAPKPALAEVPPVVEEPEAEEVAPQLSREEIAAASLKALQKLDAVIEAVQDLQTAFQELHEAATKGEPHEEIQEEA